MLNLHTAQGQIAISVFSRDILYAGGHPAESFISFNVLYAYG